jgi:hypothetical protein
LGKLDVQVQVFAFTSPLVLLLLALPLCGPVFLVVVGVHAAEDPRGDRGAHLGVPRIDRTIKEAFGGHD